MEIIPENTSVHPRSCIGCKAHNRDIMLSFLQDGTVHDVFLTTEQATDILHQIKERLRRNLDTP